MSQRKIYVVQKEMQGKFTLTLLMLIFLVAVISFCNLYVIGQYALDHLGSMETPQSMGSLMSDALHVLWPRLVLIILVNIIIVVIIGVFYSHQFAGPSYALEKRIRELADGNLTTRLNLRKGDSMHNVAEALNEMVEVYRNNIRKSKELLGQLKEVADGMAADEEVKGSKHAATIQGILGELDDTLHGFKVGVEADGPSGRVERAVEETRRSGESED